MKKTTFRKLLVTVNKNVNAERSVLGSALAKPHDGFVVSGEQLADLRAALDDMGSAVARLVRVVMDMPVGK